MTENWQTEITEKLQSGEDRMTVIESHLKINTDATNAMAKDTALILEVIEAGRSGLKVLAAIGAVARWLAAILTVCGLIWALIHGKNPTELIEK